MRSLFWVCAALVVICAVMSTNLWRGLRAEREQSVALRTQIGEVTNRELPAPPVPAPVAQPAPAPGAAPAKAPPVLVAVPAPATPSAESLIRFAEQQRELWKDPEYRKARLAQIRAQIPGNNPGLAEELGLSEAEANRLFDLLAEYELNMNSTITTLSASANDPSASQETSRRLTEFSRQRDDAIAAALGPARQAQWQQYQQNSSARSQAKSMNTMLTQAGLPLNKDQLGSLTRALVAEQQRSREDMMALSRNVNAQDPVARAQVEQELRKRQDTGNQRALAAAAPLLSADQLELMRAQFEQQSALSRATSRARERAAARQQGAQ